MSKIGGFVLFIYLGFVAVSQLTEAGLNNKRKKRHKVMLVLPHQFSRIWR